MQLHPESHVDHGLTEAQLHHLLDRYAARDGRFIETFELPPELGDAPCSLIGPAMGDQPVPERDVSYVRRGDRTYLSRCITRPPHRTRKVTVIAGPHAGLPCVLYTAFGGPPAPQEPPELLAKIETASPDERPELLAKLRESREFWSEHALAFG